VTGVNIAMTGLPAVPMYDVAVYGYFNNSTVAIKPAYLNMQAGKTTVAASGVGLGSNGQAPGLSARFMGGSAIVPGGGVRPYQSGGYTYLALDVAYSPFSSPGVQHLIITTPNFLHVLPNAVQVTQANPPTVQSVTPNADGTLTIAGTNWSAGTNIFFDGLPAAIASLNPATNTAIVTPPAGTSGQVAVLTAYNPDGQNSQFVQSASPATYTYGTGSAQAIVSVSPASLPAGAEAMVDIASTGFSFVPGQTAVGFGSADISVRQVFVLGPNHVQADVSVASGAVLSSPDVSLFSGFQTATRTAGFHITAAVSGQPEPVPVLTNALPGLNGVYAGAIVALYGSNLMASATATPSITFNGQPAGLLYSSATQINLQIPAGLAAGTAVMQLNNGAVNAYPLAVQIDSLPAVITEIRNASGTLISDSFPAVEGDLLKASVTGFAPDGAVVAPAQVEVGVGGVMHTALAVTQPAPGAFEVTFRLNQKDPVGAAQSLIVYLNGRSSYPVTIPVLAAGAGN
jgi:uncharacterized protein (TIGR03437 family)